MKKLSLLILLATTMGSWALPKENSLTPKKSIGYNECRTLEKRFGGVLAVEVSPQTYYFGSFSQNGSDIIISGVNGTKRIRQSKIRAITPVKCARSRNEPSSRLLHKTLSSKECRSLARKSKGMLRIVTFDGKVYTGRHFTRRGDWFYLATLTGCTRLPIKNIKKRSRLPNGK